MSLSFSIFQEEWWLRAVTGDRYEEATVKQGNQVVGRLPFVMSRHGPFKISKMPEFTHLLGPAVQSGGGKPQTQLMRRLSITRELIEQLPSCAFVKQVFDPTLADGLAIADGLAFQDRHFEVSPQYTFQIDAGSDPAIMWEAMHFKVRQHIRRADERYRIAEVDDPNRFIGFYIENLKRMGRKNLIDFSGFPRLFEETQARSCGLLLSAVTDRGTPAAMAFLVWGHGVMYYLLSTRAPELDENGAVSLLIWTAMKRAHQLNVRFDLDGVYSSGSARFLIGFGGRIGLRLIAVRTQKSYRTLQAMKRQLYPNPSVGFA